jgi:tetratricopeptide (TPR) repeat protein
MGINLSTYAVAKHEQGLQRRGVNSAKVKQRPDYAVLAQKEDRTPRRTKGGSPRSSASSTPQVGLAAGVGQTLAALPAMLTGRRRKEPNKSGSGIALTSVHSSNDDSHESGLDEKDNDETIKPTASGGYSDDAFDVLGADSSADHPLGTMGMHGSKICWSDEKSNQTTCLQVPTANEGRQKFQGMNFPVQGLKLSHIRSLKVPADRTVYEICKEIIRPLTNATQLSYVDYLVLKGAQEDVKETADVFVSYAWRYKWGQLLEALSTLDDSLYLWMDLFVVNQHTAGTNDLNGWLETFSGAIQAIGKVVFVLAPWRCPLPVTRAWCVFEILTALQTEVEREILVPRSEFEDLVANIKQGVLARGSRTELGQIVLLDVLRDINVMRANATRDEDKKVILTKIMQRGIVDVNNVVLLPIKNWYLEVVRAVLTEEHTAPLSIERGNAYAALYALLEMLGRPTEALEAALMCLDCWRRSGVDALGLALGLRQVGTAYFVIGAWSTARGYLRESLDVLGACDVAGSDAKVKLLEQIQALRELATVEAQLGCLDEGVRLAKHAFDLMQSALKDDEELSRVAPHRGKQFPLTPSRASTQADARKQTEHDDKSELAGEFTFRKDLQVLGDCATTLGALEYRRGRTDVAKDFFERAYAAYEAALGDDHPRLGMARANLAMCLNKEGRSEEALDLCKQARFIVERTLGADHVEMAAVEHNLALSALGVAEHLSASTSHGQPSAVHLLTPPLDKSTNLTEPPSVTAGAQSTPKENEHPDDVSVTGEALRQVAVHSADHAVQVWSEVLGDDHETTKSAREFWDEKKTELGDQ